MKIQIFSFRKMHLKISSAKWRLFCRGGDESTKWHPLIMLSFICPRWDAKKACWFCQILLTFTSPRVRVWIAIQQMMTSCYGLVSALLTICEGNPVFTSVGHCAQYIDVILVDTLTYCWIDRGVAVDLGRHEPQGCNYNMYTRFSLCCIFVVSWLHPRDANNC